VVVPPNKGVYLSLEEMNRRINGHNWKIISEYKGSHIPVDIQCLICGEIKRNIKTSHIKGSVCLKCNGKTREHTLESFNKNIAELGWVVVGEFHGTKKPCVIKCLICGREEKLSLGINAYTHKCINCTNEQVKIKRNAKEKIINALAEKGFDLVSGYKHTKSEIIIRCRKCNFEQALNKADYVHYFPIECKNCGTHICLQCGKEFIITSKRNRNFCYECAPLDENGTAYGKAKLRYKKKLIMERYGSACSKCGYNECFSALEFHHPNPLEKHPEYTPCELIRIRDLEKIYPELDKCVLLCSNCHRKVHKDLHDEKEKTK
jgi:hypothetical protein